MDLINLNRIQYEEEWISKGKEFHKWWRALAKAIAKLTGVVVSLIG